MPVILNASTSSGFVQTADTSGQIVLQSNGTTELTVASTGITVADNLVFNSGYGSAVIGYGCRAWVNFNGTGTPTIRASGNVGSITDNGVGDYTLNFGFTLVDANYAYVVGMRNDPATGSGANSQTTGATSTAQTTTQLRITTGTPTVGSLADYSTICVSIFR